MSSHLIECLVIEPPTSGEVYSLAMANMSIGDFELTLKPTGFEVPRLKSFAEKFRLQQFISGGVDEDSRITARPSDSESDYAAIVITLPVINPDGAATATLVTKD